MAPTDPAGLSARAGRRFGLEIGIGLVVLGAVLARRGKPMTVVLVIAAAGVALAIVALRAPVLLAPIARRWLVVSERVTRVTSPLLLAVLYYGLLTPIALVRRTVWGSPLRRDAAARSYWVARAPSTHEEQCRAMEHLS